MSMGNQQMPATASLAVLSAGEVSERAREALCASAAALGHKTAPAFVAVHALEPGELGILIHRIDPWFALAIDDTAAAALKAAFPGELDALAPDHPVTVRGYTFVLVPAFEKCIDELEKKRVAWRRLKVAQYPGAPL